MQPRSIQIGMYNLYFTLCEPTLSDMVLDRNTIWKNPNGYLPGRMAPLSNFYRSMLLAFLILGIFWFSQYVRFWKEDLHLHSISYNSRHVWDVPCLYLHLALYYCYKTVLKLSVTVSEAHRSLIRASSEFLIIQILFFLKSSKIQK